MTARGLLGALGLLGLLAEACGGQSTPDGADEPLRVYESSTKSGAVLAQFEEGDLPGVKAPADVMDASKLVHPTIPAGGPSQGQFVHVGQAGFGLSGQATSDAVAIGVRLEDAGTGYWLFPIATVLNAQTNNFDWSVTADVGPNAPTGTHNLEFVAFDANGRAGTLRETPFCFEPQIPDNLNACVPTREPPYLVVSLAWDRPVDLDLDLVTPAGRQVNSKHPTSAVPSDSGAIDPTAPGVGNLDRDANAGCVVSGANLENIVFKTKPPAGTYYVYANLVDACGQPSVRFDVSLHKEQAGGAPGTFKVVEVPNSRKASSMLAVEANGGTGLGLYVTEFVIQ